MKVNMVALVLRSLLGLLFVVMGSNKFFGFMPMPELSAPAGAFMGAMAATGYLIPLIGLTEVVAGLMLLTGFFSALGLVILMPVIVNILMFHIFLDQAGLPLAVVLIVVELYLIYVYSESGRDLFHPASKTDRQ